ncbi:hypothetical protein THH46_04290 [Pseudomonas sp. NA13]
METMADFSTESADFRLSLAAEIDPKQPLVMPQPQLLLWNFYDSVAMMSFP